MGLRKGKMGTHEEDPPWPFMEDLLGVHPRGGGGRGTHDPWDVIEWEGM